MTNYHFEALFLLGIAGAVAMLSAILKWLESNKQKKYLSPDDIVLPVKPEQTVSTRFDLQKLVNHAAMIVGFSSEGKSIVRSFIVHVDDIECMKEFFIKHHYDPGIDYETGAYNTLALEKISVRYFCKNSYGWLTMSEHGGGFKNHVYPASCAELDVYGIKVIFLKKAKEQKKEKLATIIPIR